MSALRTIGVLLGISSFFALIVFAVETFKIITGSPGGDNVVLGIPLKYVVFYTFFSTFATGTIGMILDFKTPKKRFS